MKSYMKINRLETHDRLLHFKKDQEANIFQGAEDCLKKNPDSLSFQMHCPYVYLFAHPRTADDGVTKRMIWQPRLTKPFAQTNSYLFRAMSHTDIIEICWLLPPEETWSQYIAGNVTEHEFVIWSIDQYCKNKEKLDAPHPDDFPDEKVRKIYGTIAGEKSYSNLMDRLWKTH